VFAAGASVFVAGAALASDAGAAFAAGASVVVAGASAGVSPTLCKTETLPCNAGIEISSAVSMKTLAATIVTRPNTEAVPRGPNAVLEILLVNNAPASVLPGCSNTEPINRTHEAKNNVYKTYNNSIYSKLLIVHYLCEAFRFQTCTADQGSVYIGLRHQGRDVVRLYRAAIQDPYGICCVGSMSFSQY
jgi:hypothetical protein